MKNTKSKFWIKERHNPQVGVYFVPMGQLSKRRARDCEKPLYGSNIMHPFDTLEEVNAELARLRKDGKEIH